MLIRDGRTKFSELRDTMVVKSGAPERLAGLRVETLRTAGPSSAMIARPKYLR